jgi:uncharacterized membrane protein YdbT with pleckstrin-like domain
VSTSFFSSGQKPSVLGANFTNALLVVSCIYWFLGVIKITTNKYKIQTKNVNKKECCKQHSL